MGNSCGQLHAPNHSNKHKYYVPKEQALVATRSLTINRQAEPGNNLRQGTPIIPTKVQRVHTEERHVAPETLTVTANLETLTLAANLEDKKISPVITAAIDTQAEEPLIPQSNEDDEPPILKTIDEENTSSDCKLVPDEICEEETIKGNFICEEETIKGNDLVYIPIEYDECPTCLEGYDEENPKIVTKCNHHYHLACIFEWMERSATCPTCFKVMEFEETS